MEVFAQIWAWGGGFCFNLVVVTQILKKNQQIQQRSSEDPVVETHFDFDRPDRCPLETDST